MRTSVSAVTTALLLATACSSGPPLQPITPAKATEQLAAARNAFALDPANMDRRIAYGRAQYLSKDYSQARRTVEPLLAVGGRVGAEANLYAGAAAQAMGDLPDARVAYLRYLSIAGSNADVEGRLGDIARKEAMIDAQRAIKDEAALNPATFPPSSVGVTTLTVASNDSTLMPLGYGLADLLLSDLAISSQLVVVDRVRISAILRELELSHSGRVDTLSAPQLGKLVGASRLVNGAITPLPKKGLAVDARVTNVEHGTAVGRPVSQHTSLTDILDGEKDLALQLFTELGVTLTPAQRAAVERRPTRYLSAFLAYSRGASAEAQWNLDAAESYYTVAVSIDPGFVLAQQRLAAVRANSGRPRANQLPVEPDYWIESILGGVAQGVNPSPGDVLGPIGNTINAPLEGTLSAAAQGTVIIIIGNP
jgi:tetratricopeptide (TPR) repeat protein